MSPCEGNLIEKNNSNCTPIRRSLRTAGTPISTALKDDRISRKCKLIQAKFYKEQRSLRIVFKKNITIPSLTLLSSIH